MHTFLENVLSFNDIDIEAVVHFREHDCVSELADGAAFVDYH
jgi:hypothetical protein